MSRKRRHPPVPRPRMEPSRNYRIRRDADRRKEAERWERQIERLQPALRLAHMDDAVNAVVHAVAYQVMEEMVDEQDALVDSICQHFPGLAPALRAVAIHAQDMSVHARDRCQEAMALAQRHERY